MGYTARLQLTCAFIVISTLFIQVRSAQADSFTFTPIDAPGSNQTYADSINNKGQVAGYYQTSSGSFGFVENNGSFTTLNLPGGVLNTSNFGIGINDNGQIVGQMSQYDSNGNFTGYVGFLDSGGKFTTITNSSAIGGVQPTGINNSGQIIGFFNNGSGTVGFVDTHGTFSLLSDPNATGGASIPYAINNRGQVVGWFDQGSTTHGYLYSGGIYTTIEDPLAPNATFATGINDRGQIVG